jgi:hypothetical protein
MLAVPWVCPEKEKPELEQMEVRRSLSAANEKDKKKQNGYYDHEPPYNIICPPAEPSLDLAMNEQHQEACRPRK